jgi:hypothetical protein
MDTRAAVIDELRRRVSAIEARECAGDRTADGECADFEGPPTGLVAEATIGMPLVHVPDGDLTAAAGWVSRQRVSADVALVALVAELEQRGVDSPGGLSRVDWLRHQDSNLSAAQAKSLVTVARSFSDPRWADLRARVMAGEIPIGNAAQVLDFHERTHPIADPFELDAAVTQLMDEAGSATAEKLARVVRHHSETISPPRDLDQLDHARQQGPTPLVVKTDRCRHGQRHGGPRPRGRRRAQGGR